jgi:peptidoglycan-associated lipoprotein
MPNNPKHEEQIMPTQSRLSSAALSILAALFIAGCSSTATGPVNQQEPVEQNPEVVAPVEVVEEVISDFAEDNNTPVDGSGQPISRTFYFEYDKSILNPSDLAVLEVHAQILRRNADRSVVVQGHCDERGTREYNLALGERRAAAISSFLRSAGVGSRQIEVVSYGEERPQNPAHNSAAWAQNRRAVVEYR